MTSHNKSIYAVALGILSTIALHAMEQAVAIVDQSRAQRLVQLKNLLLQKMPPQGKIFERSCNKIYGDNGFHDYLKFSPNGQYLIELKCHNIADFVITNMKTGKSKCCPIRTDHSYDSPIITCNDHNLIIASRENIFKIDMEECCIVDNFAKKIDGPSHQLGDGYYIKELVYNPAASNFISVTRFSDSDDLLCIHDDTTGDVKLSYKHNCHDVKFSRDGLFFTARHKNNIVVHDGKTGEIKHEIPMSPSYNDIAWHPCNPLLVLESSNIKKRNKTNYTVWDATKAEVIKKFSDRWDEKDHWVVMMFSDNGNYFITYNTLSGNINIRNGKTFKIIGSIITSICYTTEHHDILTSISSDSKYFIFGTRKDKAPQDDICQDTIFLYDLEKHTIVTMPAPNLEYLQWCPGTDQFISSCTTSTKLTLWDLFDSKTTCALKDLENEASEREINFVFDVCNGKKFNPEDPIDLALCLCMSRLPDSVDFLLKNND